MTAGFSPMLARLAGDLPVGPEWVYEPKWDGFRALVFVESGGVSITGRGGGRLETSFPDVAASVATACPPGSVLDGELVALTSEGVDFDALLRRLDARGDKAAELSSIHPAGLFAFDALKVAGRDLRGVPFAGRRAELESLVDGGVRITPQTTDPDVARAWLTTFAERGVEGVVAKRTTDPYAAGKRLVVKVKTHRTIDCVVGGFRGEWGRRGSLVLGLFEPRGLRYVGQTSLVSPAVAAACGTRLEPADDSPFDLGRPGGGRFGNFRFGPGEWTPVHPGVTVEVGFTALTNSTFRHAARFLRWRDDKPAGECAFDQLPPR